MNKDNKQRAARSSGSDSAAHPPVLRISQLDALELDSALEQLLWTQFTQCFQNCRPGVLTPVEPELKALLYLLLWRFTLYCSSATIGQSLLSLQYQSIPSSSSHYKQLSPRQKFALAILTAGPRWLQERSYRLLTCLGLNTRGTVSETDGGLLKEGFRKALSVVSGLAKFATLVNFLVFLRNGRHPVLAERFAGAQAVFSKPHVVRDVSYQYMNRELLWHGFAEFLIFLLPLVNLRKLKTAVLLHVLGGKSSDEERAREAQDLWKDCGLCGEWPTMPHTVGCRHIFCYYCIKSHSISDAYLTCPKCGAEAGTPRMAKMEMQVVGR